MRKRADARAQFLLGADMSTSVRECNADMS